MIKYNFVYQKNARVMFEVDTNKFTYAIAQQFLDYFSWHYEHNEDIIDVAIQKYAIEAIFLATANGYTTTEVRKAFDTLEGFYPVDGSHGIQLMRVSEFEFRETDLRVSRIEC